MRNIILGLPEQLVKGIELGKVARIKKPKKSIISCGMGGSSVAGEMLSMVTDNVIVHWDYDLPKNASIGDLVVCTSWSGDTEETISSYQQAHKLGIPTLVVTHGGQLAKLAQKHGSPIVMLPADNIPPITAVGYIAGALFSALGLEQHLPETLDASKWEQVGKELSLYTKRRLPVFYASYPWRKLTGFWKMVYSETAKRQAFANWFPSGAHNEVVGWDSIYQSVFAPVFFRETGESPRYAKNFDALLAIFKEKKYTAHTVTLSGDTLLEKVFNNYLLALWTSLYAAQLLGVDPKARTLLDRFKRLKADL